MRLLDALKSTAVKILNESDLGKQTVALVQEAAQKFEGASVELLSNHALYRTKVSDPVYAKLPQVLRSLFTPEQWHEFLFAAKDSFFIIENSRLGLHPGFKAGVHEFVQQLLHGKKGERAGEAQAAEPKVLPPQEPEA